MILHFKYLLYQFPGENYEIGNNKIKLNSQIPPTEEMNPKSSRAQPAYALLFSLLASNFNCRCVSSPPLPSDRLQSTHSLSAIRSKNYPLEESRRIDCRRLDSHSRNRSWRREWQPTSALIIVCCIALHAGAVRLRNGNSNCLFQHLFYNRTVG